MLRPLHADQSASNANANANARDAGEFGEVPLDDYGVLQDQEDLEMRLAELDQLCRPPNSQAPLPVLASPRSEPGSPRLRHRGPDEPQTPRVLREANALANDNDKDVVTMHENVRKVEDEMMRVVGAAPLESWPTDEHVWRLGYYLKRKRVNLDAGVSSSAIKKQLERKTRMQGITVNYNQNTETLLIEIPLTELATYRLSWTDFLFDPLTGLGCLFGCCVLA